MPTSTAALIGGQLLRGGVEVGLRGGFDTIGIATEIYGIGIHGDDFLLGENRLQLNGDDPLLALDDEQAEYRNLAEQTRRILRTDTEHVLCQLLRDGRSTAPVMMQECILGSSKNTDRIDTDVLVETFILGIYQSLEEGRVTSSYSTGVRFSLKYLPMSFPSAV